MSVKRKLISGFISVIFPFVVVTVILMIRIATINHETMKLSNQYLEMLSSAEEIETSLSLAHNSLQAFVAANRVERMQESKNHVENTEKELKKLSSFMYLFDDKDSIKIVFNESNEVFLHFESLTQAIYAKRDERENYYNNLQTLKANFQKNLEELKSINDNLAQSNINAGNKSQALINHQASLLISEIIPTVGSGITINTLKNEESRKKVMLKLDKTFEFLYKNLHDQKSIDILNKLNSTKDDYINFSTNFLNLYLESDKTLTEVQKTNKELQEKSHKLKTCISNLVNYSSNHVNKNILHTRMALVLALIVVAIIIFFMIHETIKRIITPLKDTFSKAVQLSSGDLTVEFPYNRHNDEIGRLHNAMGTLSENLKKIVNSINNSASRIATTGGKMNNQSQQMTQSANEQAASAEEVSSSIEEMSSSIQQNSDNARETERIALSNSNTIKSCSMAASQTVLAMNQIADKISVVDDIAFQTNILALNAAVEAARAGEHGKGFAVVAAEVRKLAEKCATAAKEIDQVSKNGVNVATQTGDVFAQVLPEIERTTTLVQEIAAACHEQATGSELINSAVQRFNGTTQQFAQISQEMATGSNELYQYAEKLIEMIKYFKI